MGHLTKKLLTNLHGREKEGREKREREKEGRVKEGKRREGEKDVKCENNRRGQWVFYYYLNGFLSGQTTQ